MELTNEELAMAIVEAIIMLVGADVAMVLSMIAFLAITIAGLFFEWRTRRQTQKINQHTTDEKNGVKP